MQVLKTFFSFIVLFLSTLSISANSILTDTTNKTNLVIREICGYTLHQTDEYFSICYQNEFGELQDVVINDFFKIHKDEIEKITIENPSRIIQKLNFRILKNLNSLVIFGNDYDTDGLQKLPKKLLKLSALKSIEFEGVRFPKSELEKIKAKYPNVDIIGNISEY